MHSKQRVEISRISIRQEYQRAPVSGPRKNFADGCFRFVLSLALGGNPWGEIVWDQSIVNFAVTVGPTIVLSQPESFCQWLSARPFTKYQTP